MAIKITREEYQKKFGVAPAIPSTTSKPIAPKPAQPQGIGGVQGFGAGLAKSGLNLARGTSQVLQGAGQRLIAGALPGVSLNNVRNNTGLKSLNNQTPQGAGVSEILKPQGGAEKFGSFVGDTAQFALPLSKVSKVGQVATGASRLQRAGGLAQRAATEGAISGGVVTAQQGGIDREAKDTAIISALFPVAGKAMKSTAQVFKNPKNGGRVINSLIKPLAKDFSYGKNPGRAIAEEGIVANNMDDLLQKIDLRRNEIGQKIDMRLSSPEIQKIKIDVSDLVKPLNEAYKQAAKAPSVNSGILMRLTDTINDLQGIRVENGINIPTRSMKDISPLEATEIKRLIGDITKFTGNESDDKIVNKALKQAYGITKEKIEAAVPGIKPLNERYADLISAKIATEHRDKIMQRQNMVQFIPKISMSAGLAGTIFTGGNPIPVLLGLGEAGVQKLLSSPGAKTRFAKWLSNAPAEQKTQLIQKAPWIKGMILEANKQNI